ncbi:MAG: ABC transporter permease [Hyphomicrobium sp.]
MILTLAFRNLFHDRIRLVVTMVGILFSIVLVAVQLGLYLGSRNMITNMIERTNSDLWITIFGAKSFEEGGILLAPGQRHQALATPGVKAVIPIISSFAEWRKPSGGSTRVVVVGIDKESGGLEPWNLVHGTWEDIRAPDAIAVDQSYLKDLGIEGIGSTAQIAVGRVKVRALTDGIRSFTQSPYVFTTLQRARNLLNLDGDRADKSTFFLVQLEPNAKIEEVRKTLQERLDGTEVLTKLEFRNRSLRQWLFKTGAGIALIGGALLGILVGTVIVAQTLYSSTKDHINEFATLRALGSSATYIYKVILAQAGLSAILGYILGMTIALTILYLSRNSPLPLVMTPSLAFWLFALTVFMCAISAVSAIIKVTKIDPATVFSR